MTDETKDIPTLFLAIKLFLTIAPAWWASIAFQQHAKLAITCGLCLGVIIQNLVPPALNKKRTVGLLLFAVAYGVVRSFIR